MDLSKFRRGFAKIGPLFCLTILFCLGIKPAFAQQIVSASFNPATSTITAQDSAGDVYTANLAGVLRTGTGTVPATFMAPGGPAQPVTLTVSPAAGGQLSVTGVLPTQLAINCGVNTVALSASCNLTPAPVLQGNIARSLAASTTGEVRSQSSAITYMITDRLRSIARGLAEGAQPGSTPTPPGGTVTLPEFSWNAPGGATYGGASAGSPDARLGMWANASGSYLSNSTATGYNGSSVVALTGIDYILDRQWIAGFTAGYTHADLSLKPSTVSHEVDGAVVGPYASYIINPNMAVDALFNYTSLGNNLSAPVPLPAGNYHSDRLTGAADLDVFSNYGALKLTGYGGYTYTWEGGNAGSLLGLGLADNIRYGAVRLGGEVAYDMGPFEPYLPLTFEYETTTPTDGTSRAALIPGAGFRYRWSDTLAGGMLFQTTEIKTHTRDYLIGAHLRWSF